MRKLGEPDTAADLRDKKIRSEQSMINHFRLDAGLLIAFVAAILWEMCFFTDPNLWYVSAAFIPFAGFIFHHIYMSDVHRETGHDLECCGEYGLKGNWENYDESSAFMKKIHDQNRLPTQAEMRNVNSWSYQQDTLEAWDNIFTKKP